MIPAGFLTIGMVFLLYDLFVLRTPVTVEKTGGTIYRAAGRERPHELFGRLEAEKWGRSRPFWCFFHGDFRLHWFPISYASKKLLAPQAEERAEDEAEGSSPYTLQLFLSGCCSGTPNRQSTSVAKWTVAWRLLPPNSRRMSDSLTRATFHPR